MPDPLARLAVWLQPFSVTSNAETLAERRRLVTGLADDVALDPHTLVAAAHGHGIGESLGAAIGRIDGSVIVDGQDQLAATLAAAALVVRLTDTGRDDRTVSALLVQSAGFIGLEPAVPDLPAAAAIVLAGLARRERHRAEAAETTREVRNLLASAGSSAEDVDDSAASLKKAVLQRDQALRALAKRVETLVTWTESRLALVDEELDILWWSRGGRSLTTQEPWERLPPPQRAAVAASELGRLLAQVPAPPSARSILRTTMGADADTETPIVAVVAAMQCPEGARRLPLTPLSTFALIAAELGGGEEEAAARLFAKTVPMDADARRPLIEAAEQVLREGQIVGLQ